MRIYSEDGPNGVRSYTIDVDGTENAEFRSVLEGWLDALEFHEHKSRGYKNRDKFSLGISGEFVGFWRKAQKLYAAVWESTTLTGEGTQEVLMDTFGSVGLMLQALRKRSDKYNATWRDNHGNKPTFGPGPAKSITTTGEMHFFPAHKHVFIGEPARCIVCTLPEAAERPNVRRGLDEHVHVFVQGSCTVCGTTQQLWERNPGY